MNGAYRPPAANQQRLSDLDARMRAAADAGDVATARKLRAEAAQLRMQPDRPAMEANGTAQRFPGTPVAPRLPDPRADGLPPLPPGFVLDDEPQASGGMPPLPPGFELEPETQNVGGPRFPGVLVDETDPKFGGVAMNATAGLNEGLYGVAGLLVDAMRGAMNLTSRGINAVTGSDLPQIPENSFGGSRWIGETLGGISPELDPRNTEAATAGERVMRSAGQGVGSVVAPAGAVAGLARAGAVGPQVARAGEAAFGRAGSVGDAALGAVGGAGGAVGQEIAPEGYEGVGALAGGIAGGGAGYGVARGLDAATASFYNAGRERLAGDRLVDGASDPDRLRRSLANDPEALVPGSAATTFQRTGDLGIGVMEKDAANRFPERFAERRGAQNEARVGAMRGIEADGAPERVAATVRQRLDAIEAETERMMSTATEQARQRVGAIGAPMSPEGAGNAMRSALEEARAAAKAQERTLWSAVDPNGSLSLSAANARRQAVETVQNLPASAKPLSGEEAAILSTLRQYPEGAVPFGEITAMSSRIKAELRAERMANGETPAYARLSRLSAALQSDLDTAIAGRVAQEAEAVAAGRMSFEDTMFAKLRGEQEGWFAGRQTTARAAGGGADPVGYGAGGQAPVPGARGTEGAQGGRPSAGARDPRLAGAAEPNFDAEALGRLNAANAATRERAQTFDNDTLGPIRKRPGSTAPYTMLDSVVPTQVFNPTPRSFEAIGRLKAAVGDEAATEALTGYAVGRAFRAAALPDGTLDPARLNAWRRSHSDALRALPGLDTKLSDAGSASQAIAEVATAREAHRKAMEAGAVGRLLGVDAPEDVTRIVGGVFSRQDAVAQMGRLRQAVGNDAEAQKGLRRAVVEHMTGRFVGNVEVGTSGTGGMRLDGFQNFVKANGSALRAAGFSPDEMRMLSAIADDLQRSGRSMSSVKNPGGSDTAQNAFAAFRGDTPFSAAARLLAAPGAAGIGVGMTSGTMTGVAAGAMAGLGMAMRNAGLRTVDDLVADALLNPERARQLLAKVPAGQEKAWAQTLARSFANTALRSAGTVPPTEGRKAYQAPRGPMRLPDRMPPQLGERRPTALEEAMISRGAGGAR